MHDGDTSRLSQVALQGHFAVGQCRDTLRLPTADTLWFGMRLRALWHCRARGYSADSLRLGTEGMLGGWMLCGWAVRGGEKEHGLLKT